MKKSETDLTILDILQEGEGDVRMIKKNKVRMVRDHLELTPAQTLHASEDFISFAVGAIKLGLKIQIINGTFKCPEEEHLTKFALKVSLDESKSKFVCLKHAYTETQLLHQSEHDHEGIVNLRRSFDD